MTLSYLFTPQAKKDAAEIALYIADDNWDAADYFLLSLEKACLRITGMPEIGRVLTCSNKKLASIRAVRVSKTYSAYLIFYRKTNKRIEIIRVLHGSRDYPTLFNF